MHAPDSPPKRAFFKKRDILIILALLILALFLYFLITWGKTPGAVAVVVIGYNSNQDTRYIELDKDQIIDIEAALPVHLQVEDGSIRFIHSVCPDHDCEAFGRLQNEGDWAACLPAGVTVRIEKQNLTN